MIGYNLTKARYWPYLAALFFSFLILTQLFYGFGNSGGRDWDYFEADLVSARKSILIDHEFPFWMPFRAGGQDAFADPQSLIVSPLGILSLIFGIPAGIRIFLTMMVGLTALGTIRLGEELGISKEGCLISSLIMSVGYPLAFYAAGGVPTFSLGLCILPWIVYLLHNLNPKKSIIVGLLLAIVLYGGDINHFIFHSLYISIILLTYAIISRNKNTALLLVIIFGSCIFISAPKLIPSYILSKNHPRITNIEHHRALTIKMLGQVLANRNTSKFITHSYENLIYISGDGSLASMREKTGTNNEPSYIDLVNSASYIGKFYLTMALIGWLWLINKVRKTSNSAFCLGGAGIASLFFLWLSLGTNVSPSSWWLLHHLPLFSSLQDPSRLVLYFYFFLVLLIGYGVDLVLFIASKFTPPIISAIMFSLLLFVALFDISFPALSVYKNIFIENNRSAKQQILETKKDVGEEFVQIFSQIPFGSSFYGVPVTPFAKAGIGVLNGYSAVPAKVASIEYQNNKYFGEAASLSGQLIDFFKITGRTITIKLFSSIDDTIIINQNWEPGWGVKHPSTASSYEFSDGRIAVRITRGNNEIVLQYTPPGLALGLCVFFSFVGIIASSLFWRGTRKPSPVSLHLAKHLAFGKIQLAIRNYFG